MASFSRRMVLAMFLGATAGAGSAFGQVIDYKSDDAEMNAAIAQAKRALPDFVALYRDGKGERHAVKVAIPHAGGREHIWMSVTGLEGDAFTGAIANRPVYVKDLRQGATYRAGSAMITDWSYYSGGLMHGGYTTRVSLKELTPAEVQRLGLRLAPLP